MADPTTEAGRTLLEAFTTPVDSPDFAIRLSEESVVRHAVPHIEAEAVAAYRRALAERVRGLPEHGTGHGIYVWRAAVLALIEDEA